MTPPNSYVARVYPARWVKSIGFGKIVFILSSSPYSSPLEGENLRQV